MKKHLLLISLALFAQSALANISLQNFGFRAAAGQCSQLAGVWTGTGTVKSGMVTCHYNGRGVISQGKGNAISMDVKLKKDSGWMCPKDENIVLPGTCQGGSINFQTDKANLDGSLGADGMTADLHGTVTIDSSTGPVTATVSDMHLIKQK